MDRPLGHACGNALEVAEAIDVLKGGGPPDLIEVTMALGARMLVLGAAAATLEAAHAMLRDAIRSGKALLKLEEIVSAQGGDTAAVRDPSRLPRAARHEEFTANRDGIIQSVDPKEIGYGIIALGGGRTTMEDTVDPSVGFVISAKPGARVVKGQSLAMIHARTKEDVRLGREVLEKAIVIGEKPASPLPLVSHLVTTNGVEEV